MAGIDWLTFVPAAALISLVPGANQLLSLRNAVRHGTGPATVALLGRFSAFALLIALVAAGLGAALVASPVAFAVVTWAGVAYLAWIGASTLWRLVRRRDEPEHVVVDDPRGGRWTLARREFITAVTNPKALLLFAALLPQFLPAGGGGWDLALLGAAYTGIEAVVGLGYTVLGGRIGSARLTRRVARRIEAVTGTMFLALAAVLAVES